MGNAYFYGLHLVDQPDQPDEASRVICRPMPGGSLELCEYRVAEPSTVSPVSTSNAYLRNPCATSSAVGLR